MLRFILRHPRILSFGLLLTLFSSFGQTFLISIFVPRLLESFGLGTAAFGALYAAATLTSALTLPFFGRLIDRVSLPAFSLAAGGGLALACFGMALSWNVPSLFLSIVGLRLTGQGLLGLTASTAMARIFSEGRGKALSVSALGYPLGEGLLPLLVVLMIHTLGWRVSWLILGGVILLVLLPAVYSLLRGQETGVRERADGSPPPPRPILFRDPGFLLLLPVILFMPLALTALFLYQIPLAHARGWTEATMASAFIGFAVARMASSLLVGPWIDRVGALRLLPWTLLPAAAGFAVIAGATSPLAAYAYLLLVGVSQGVAGPMLTAVWAERYGVETLGSTKGVVATLGILSTAAGPLLLGGLLGGGVGFTPILWGCAFCALAIVGLTLLGLRCPPRSPAGEETGR